ncbi:signal recognition particle 19 kDa protein-like [Physella acuta]|uniref:signal recognition particle 19 kDa protein-like n=1 Tax=Physella acuta TaxID=109671 RepID=UPI0027DDA2BE|nr:signal recognition particle 19 kDa protein-like [Physella acuta]
MAAATASPNAPSQARPWNPDFKHNDRERWICIYPAYLNSKKTLKEGRRIPKSKAVENPICAEIRDVCATTGFTLGVENKTYPREQDARGDNKYRGRVRVMLKNEDGSLVLPQFPSRMSVMLHIAETIPKLKTRQQSQSASQSQQQQQQQQQSKGQKKKGRK